MRRRRGGACGIGCLTLLVLWIASIYLLHVTEVQESSYATPREVVADNAIARGWIPPCLPATAHDIHEIHDLDTNRCVGRFRFDRVDLEAMLASTVAVTLADAGRPDRGYARRIASRETPVPSNISTWVLRRTAGDFYPHVIAIDATEEIAWFWIPGNLEP